MRTNRRPRPGRWEVKEWREGDGTREEGRLGLRKEEAGIRREGPKRRTGRSRKRDRRLRRGWNTPKQ